jgi:hypothetical protein
MDTDWESKYPMVSVQALEHIIVQSYHGPVLLTTGLPRPQSPRRFKFEHGWLQHDGFHDRVKEI